jgi:cytochrome c5
MKKLFVLCSIAAGSVFLVQCASKKAATVGMSAETKAKVDEVHRNYTPAQMEEGKTIWGTSCKKCHKLYTPESHSVARWEDVLPRMFKRAKLSDDDAGKVRAYLVGNAKS